MFCLIAPFNHQGTSQRMKLTMPTKYRFNLAAQLHNWTFLQICLLTEIAQLCVRSMSPSGAPNFSFGVSSVRIPTAHPRCELDVSLMRCGSSGVWPCESRGVTSRSSLPSLLTPPTDAEGHMSIFMNSRTLHRRRAICPSLP